MLTRRLDHTQHRAELLGANSGWSQSRGPIDSDRQARSKSETTANGDWRPDPTHRLDSSKGSARALVSQADDGSLDDYRRRAALASSHGRRVEGTSLY